jgi:hypothetical protein
LCGGGVPADSINKKEIPMVLFEEYPEYEIEEPLNQDDNIWNYQWSMRRGQN